MKRGTDGGTSNDMLSGLPARSVYSKAIGREIYYLRKQACMTGRQMAAQLNVSQQQVSRYENGVCSITVDTLIRMLVVLNVPLDEFLKKVFLAVFDTDSVMLEENHYRVLLSLSAVPHDLFETEH